MAKRIKLTKGKYAIVDDKDFKWLNQFKWYYSATGPNTGYAKRKIYISGKPKGCYMHRFIMNAPDGFEVDHKNRLKLDNRRSNLRICTRKQNLKNHRKSYCRNKNSKYVGVEKCINATCITWRARIYINGKNVHLGMFTTERQAAIAYNKMVKKHFGEFGNLNKIKK